MSEWTFRTENGFYLGDRVELPDGKIGFIDSLIVQRINVLVETDTGPVVGSSSVVGVKRDDGEHYGLWCDTDLTRI